MGWSCTVSPPHRGMRSAALFLVVGASSLLTGCIVDGSRHEQIEGHYIGNDSLSMIEPGITTKSWVLATFGEPTRKSSVDELGSEVWSWEYKKIRRAKTQVIVVFEGDKRTETHQTVFVEFDGDIVRRAWMDRDR